MQEVIRKELNDLYLKLGRDGLPESLSMETGLDIQSETFFLKEEAALFDDLLKVQDKSKTFYHYTSFPALVEILKSGRIRFSCPAGLNDITEISSRNTFVNEQLDGELDSARLNYITKRFIFSLTDRYDSLNQWRLYGNDGRGVCLGLDLSHVKENQDLRFGRILYGETIAAALGRIRSRIKEELHKNFDFRLYQSWGYFIKDTDYAEESEFRLIRYDDAGTLPDKDSWRINNFGAFYPYIDVDMNELNITIDTILFGPKLKERQLNMGMVEHYLWRYHKGKAIKIECSTIRSYR